MVCNNNALQSIGYGKIDPVNKTSTTHTAITDQAGLSHINTKNFKQEEVQHELNPIITNDFNQAQALKELNAQVTITQAFDTERRAIRSEFAKKAEDYRKKAKDLVDDNPRKAELETKAKQIDDNLRIFDGITSALYAPNSNGIIGDTVRAASPQLAYQIGQEFKRKDQEGSAQHLLAHAILGAATSYATGNNITTGALSGAGSEVAAPALANYLYGTNEPSELNQEQKDTIVSILNLATVTTAYTATDGNTTDAVSASEIGKVGVEWNADTIRLDGKDAHDRAFEAEAKRLFPDNPELQQQYIAQQNKKIGKVSLAIMMAAIPTEIYEVIPIGKGFGIIAKGSKKVVGLFKNKGDAQKVLTEVQKTSRSSQVSTTKIGHESDNDYFSNKPSGAREVPTGLIGKDFEDWLRKTYGGNDSFTVAGREFDGAITPTRWYEAKSGNYWNMLMSDPRNVNKFKSDMGNRQRIAQENGATYELHSNTPIPQSIKDWLNTKGIKYYQH